MPISASEISGSAAQTPVRAPSDRGLGSMKSEDFFKILITELRQQDPLAPSKTSDMISQVSQIRSIELSGELTDTLDMLARQQRTAGTSELLGKYVRAESLAGDGSPTINEGVVTGVRFASDGAALLELDTGVTVPAADVTGVTTLDQVAKPADAAARVRLDPRDEAATGLWSKVAAKARKPKNLLENLFHL